MSQTRRLAAILAADVAGYSRLMGADEEGTLERLKALRRELVDPKIAEHHGRIVETTGDGVLVEFASAVDAVRCAVEMQRGMAERPDSASTLNTINVPTLIITGDKDKMTGVAEAEIMKQNIAGSQMRVIAKAGHYSPWEQPEEVGKLLRQFLDSNPTI